MPSTETPGAPEVVAPSRRRRRSPVSVRTRIVTAITAVAALGLLVVGVSVYGVERQRILEQVDDRLAANLESARFLVTGDDDPGVTPQSRWASSSEALAAVVQRMSPDDNTGVLGMAGGVITVVPGVELDVDLQHERAFARHVDGLLSAGGPLIGTYAENGVAWRYLAVPLAVEGSPEPAEVAFVMVYDLNAELAEINTAGRAFLIASTVVILVIAGTGTLVATRLLRPLRRMRETSERISAQSLAERLPVEGNDDVAELTETINAMLDRLDRAWDSQRQLLSDVGHELKTPLTIIRGHLEVMDPTEPDDVRATRDLAVDELERMDRLVQDLSAAAALHGPSPVQPVPIDAADLLTQIVRKAQGISGANVAQGRTADVVAYLDPERVTQAVLQLVQNAVTHGGGTARIGSGVEDEHLIVWVRDWGPGVSDEEKSTVFERFRRGEQAAERPGSGLGLTIVQVIARAHGGSATVEDAPDGGARFVLRFPLASASRQRGLHSPDRIPTERT